MRHNIIIILIIITLLSAASLHSKPRVKVIGADDPIGLNQGDAPNAFIKSQTRFDANNIDIWVQNSGTFDQDIRTNNTPGLMFPKGSNRFAIFTAGLSIGAYIDGALRLATASYNGEYQPGYIDNGTPTSSDIFKIYKVTDADVPGSNPDYDNWGLMVPFGAPYVDINQNGVYEPGVDKPGIKDATQTIFVCLTDGFPENHSQSEGFSGGTSPMNAQVQLTLWAYNTQGLENLQFVNWVVINKGSQAWNNTHFSVVVDPDLGDANDDYIGCDTSLVIRKVNDFAYCYNSDNVDGNGNPPSYGQNPPASGMDFFKSPEIFTGDQNDSVVYYDPPGSENKVVKRGWRLLGLTSFMYFTNTGSGGATCEQDPQQPIEAYNYMTGVKKDGSPYLYPSNLQATKFCYAGDPESGNGWTEISGVNNTPSQAYVNNCNGTNGTVSSSSPGDRRFIFNSGDANFTINPGDTQRIVLAQFVQKGANNLNAVTKLREVDQVAQNLFNANFKVNPPPPRPVVNYSIQQASDIGTCNITLAWGDISENYNILDTLLQPAQDSSRLIFQGYQVYEIKKSASSFPEFTDPSTLFTNNVSLLAIYDRNDGIGTILDTIEVNAGDTTIKTVIPVVPPFGFAAPDGFPNGGINRSITISRTNFPDEYGGRSELIYGNTYKFAVIAYANRTNPTNSSHKTIIANSILSAIIEITPEAPVAGTEYNLQNSDTLNTNRRDLGVIPIVINQDQVITARYKIQYFGPDTTYNVLKSLDNGTYYDTVKRNLKYTFGNAQDSSKIVDGILPIVKKINNYNRGVIRDIIDENGVLLSRDSIQTRRNGWEYTPSNNRNLEGSKLIQTSDKPWQSRMMSISWPTQTTVFGLPSTVQANQTRNVEIEFTGLGNGQMAYRYLDTSTTNNSFFIYQNFVEVPFKVYEVDPTDSTGSSRRQINVAFVVSNDVSPAPAGWEPSADTLGGRLLTYIFRSDYNTTPDPFYTTKNLFIQQPAFDIMYIWSPKLINSGAAPYVVGDRLNIYPYTVTESNIAPGFPLYYEYATVQPTIGNNELASSRGDLERIKIVPNPFYAFNSLQTNAVNRFVTFRRLPEQCSIKIYTLNGDLIRTLEKNDRNSTMQYDLKNFDNVPISSGMYIALIDAPGIGNKVLKFAVMTAQERIDF